MIPSVKRGALLKYKEAPNPMGAGEWSEPWSAMWLTSHKTDSQWNEIHAQPTASAEPSGQHERSRVERNTDETMLSRMSEGGRVRCFPKVRQNGDLS